jgi:hypothetical protein
MLNDVLTIEKDKNGQPLRVVGRNWDSALTSLTATPEDVC